jgi:tetratricopeptide (TPR) repeat protein
VRKDPDDFIAQNKLAGYYLQRLRETGNTDYLALGRRTATASLLAMPAEQNTGGLTLLAQVDFASHDFAAARDHAQKLVALQPHRGSPYQLLGDALFELGDYDAAQQGFAEATRLGRMDAGMAARLARQAFTKGRTADARKLLLNAIELAGQTVPPSRETTAWCHWQLGELEFSVGRYVEAESAYRDSLTTLPNYYRGLAGLGRTRAAAGDIKAAITNYEQAVKVLPDPVLIGALGDLLLLDGRAREAEIQFALVEKIATLGKATGALYDRQLANFYADHDQKSELAYRIAKDDFNRRRDIYGADAVAWTALKAGHLREAQEAIADALRFGTEDPRLHYHSGMIQRALGNQAGAIAKIKNALRLSPEFDPRQAPLAKRTLSE